MKHLKTFLIILCMSLLFGCVASAAPVADGMYDYNGHVYGIIPEDIRKDYMYIYEAYGSICYRGLDKPVYFNNGTGYTYQKGDIYEYIWADGQWKQSGYVTYPETNSQPQDLFKLGKHTVYWSLTDVFNQDGSLYMSGDPDFFPMAERILLRAETALKTEAVPQIVGTMKILLACGVGLVALLISLPLLKRVLNLSRN